MMLSENTTTKLHEMKLSSMATMFREQLKDINFNDMPFEERFGRELKTQDTRIWLLLERH